MCDIEAIIQKGECQEIEFKESLSLIREGLKDLCSMLNTDSGEGSVLFGVSDNKIVRGITSDDEKHFDSVQKKINRGLDRFDPKLIKVSIILKSVGNQKIVVLCAERDRSTPYYEFDGKAYTRIGSSKRTLTIEEKKQLNKKRNRDFWNGPWQCDKCGSIVGTLSYITITDKGVEKSYKCACGGEYYPM